MSLTVPFSSVGCGSTCQCGGDRDTNTHPMTDRRTKRDLHALDENGMVVCNPRDREAAHRAEQEGIATENLDAVTCRKCLERMGPELRRRRHAEG